MSTRMQRASLHSLQLPAEFEDLTGVIQSDLKVIVSILTERASDRWLLSGRQSQQLQRALWSSLTETINKSLEPLSVESR
ncbi:MAG TPA: hypothetical protein VN648_20125 [Candidatus Methylomirabilis sp.]|nr:hypothetical protein [Candidatus Methylomirabilis sp.]